MSRKIKFRFWADTEERYVSNCAICGDGSILVYDDTLIEQAFDGEIIAEQFTGLTDKNGVEIYEGDIVHIEGWGRGVITFNNARFVAKDIENNEMFYWLGFAKVDHSAYLAKVIGNIHKHLLED